MCCAARPEWPLASRDGRLAKADGPGNSAGTVALEPLRRGTAAIAFRRADRHLGEIGLRCAAAKQARRQSALCRTSAAVYSDARSAGMVLISATNLATLPAPPSSCCCVCRLLSPLCAVRAGAVATLGTPDGHRSVPLLCMDSWLAHCGCTGSPLPCYRLRGSPACAGATADGSLRWATAERPIPCISLTQMATGGSSHPEATRHVGLAADAWLGRYMRAVSFGRANVRLFAHRCARHSTLFGDLTDLSGILPVQRLIGLTVRPSLPPRAARGGQLACRCQPER